MDKKKVGIIIVNYKDYAEKYLAECRDSLRAQSYPRELTQIYIVDNASTDKTRRFLTEHYPEAAVIPRPDGNYAAANNSGIKKALEDGCELAAIANMDVKFAPDWLKELVSAADSDPVIGIAQSRILLYPKKIGATPIINTLGNICHFLGFGFTSGYGEPDRLIEGLPEISGYASGCSFIIKKEALEKINGYNEEFYMYHDDMEISLKARLAGYKIVLAPKSVVYHKYEFSRSVKMLYFMERNRYLVMLIFYRLPTILLILPALIFMDFGMVIYSIPGGWLKTKISVYGYFMKSKHWRAIFRERKKIKALKKLPDKKLLKNFQGQILFQEINNPVLKYIANPLFNAYWKLVKKILIW
ncbi:MAG: glycosyltransferase family 2 protein [Patescibacteria group bacterium]|jgi:hypothetical protein